MRRLVDDDSDSDRSSSQGDVVDDDDVEGEADDDGDWTIDHLRMPNEDLMSRRQPTDDELRRLTQDLYDFWLDPSVSLVEVVEWSLRRFGVSVDGDFAFPHLESAVLARRYQFKQLLCMVSARGIMENDPHLVDAMVSIDRVITSSHSMCFSALIQYNRMEGSRNIRVPPSISDDETFEHHDPEALTSFQRLVLIMCRRFEVKKYRKSGDACFTPIITPDGHDTHSYQYTSLIRDEVYQIRKEIDFKMWRFLTNPRDNPRAVAEHMIDSDQSEFPRLNVGDGEFFAFRNGIYDIRRDLFFCYDQAAEWHVYARDMMKARRDAIAAREAEQAAAGVGADAAAGGQPPPDEDEDAGFPTRDTVCVNYFDIPFRLVIRPETVAQTLGGDAMDIPTPAFDKILDRQGFEHETKRWMFVLIGRLFFEVNRFDRWSRALFLIGAGGTGKSTIANWIMHVVPPHFHSLINANFEEQFGLSGITGDEKRVCICTELTEDLKFKQEEWQICVEGGKLQVAHKNQPSKPHTFRQHMIMCGNQFPRRWKNNGKQVSRRIVLMCFDKPVPRSQLRGDLCEDLKAETDCILRKACLSYIRMTATHGQMDLEAPGVMPEQIHTFMSKMENSIDPLLQFMRSEAIVLEEEGIVPLSEFKREYFEFRRSNGFPIVGWTKDHYERTFAGEGCVVQRNRLVYQGRTMTTDWVIGARLATEEDDDE